MNYYCNDDLFTISINWSRSESRCSISKRLAASSASAPHKALLIKVLDLCIFGRKSLTREITGE